jgi:hypothetical protein
VWIERKGWRKRGKEKGRGKYSESELSSEKFYFVLI